MMFVWGQFVAEGHAAERYALISTRDPEVQTVLEADLRAIGAPLAVAPTAISPFPRACGAIFSRD